MLSNTTIIDKIKKNIQTCNIVFHPVVAFTVDNRSKLFHYSLPMHKSQPAPPSFDSLRCSKKKKKKKEEEKEDPYVLVARERGLWKNGEKGERFAKSSIFPLNPVGPINRGLCGPDTCHVPRDIHSAAGN